jgi:heme/copper-type cytochrome/quinol oxidase subunit 2
MNTDPMDPLDPYITEDEDQRDYFLIIIGAVIIIVLVLFSIFFIRTIEKR